MSTASISKKQSQPARQRRSQKQQQQQHQHEQQPQHGQPQSSPSHYNETPRVAGTSYPYPTASVNGGAGTHAYSHLQERNPSASYVPTTSNSTDSERLQQGQQQFKSELQHGPQAPVYHQYPPQPAYLSQDIFHPSQQQQQPQQQQHQQQQPQQQQPQQQQRTQQPPYQGMMAPPGQPYPVQDPNFQHGPHVDPQRQVLSTTTTTSSMGTVPPNPNQQYYPPQPQPPQAQNEEDKSVRQKKKPGRKPGAKKNAPAEYHPYGNPSSTVPSMVQPNSIPHPYQQQNSNVPSSTSSAPSSASSSKSVTRRSRMGCLTCRQRKKRCCESRPKCTECGRLGLNCVWPKPGTEHKNKPKDQKEDENTIEHEIYGRIKVLRGIVEYRSQ
ncbi:unnamed protein product [Candida parapsilosis]